MLLDPLVLPDRDVFHFRRDNAFPGIMQLSDIASGFGSPGSLYMSEPESSEGFILQSPPPIGRADRRQLFCIPSFKDPFFPDTGNTFPHIDIDRGVRVGTAVIIYCPRCI